MQRKKILRFFFSISRLPRHKFSEIHNLFILLKHVHANYQRHLLSLSASTISPFALSFLSSLFLSSLFSFFPPFLSFLQKKETRRREKNIFIDYSTTSFSFSLNSDAKDFLRTTTNIHRIALGVHCGSEQPNPQSNRLKY